MNRSTVQKVLAWCAAAIITVLVLWSIALGHNLARMEAGATEGFAIHGTYQTQRELDEGTGVTVSQTDQSLTRASFACDDDSDAEGEFYFEFSDGEGWYYAETGRFSRTFDPNVYELTDEDGTVVGQAHVAYSRAASRLGEQYAAEGIIYITYVDEEFELEKFSNIIVRQIYD